MTDDNQKKEIPSEKKAVDLTPSEPSEEEKLKESTSDSKSTLDMLMFGLKSLAPMNTDTSEYVTTETMKGTEKDSHFLVIAKKSGLKLGIRPIVFPQFENKRTYIYLGFRLRVETCEPSGAILLAETTFGIGFHEKSGYASTVCALKLIEIPCAPKDAYNTWHDNKITENMVAQLIKRLDKKQATVTVPPSTLQEYLNYGYEKVLQDTPKNNPTEFPLLFNYKAT